MFSLLGFVLVVVGGTSMSLNSQIALGDFLPKLEEQAGLVVSISNDLCKDDLDCNIAFINLVLQVKCFNSMAESVRACRGDLMVKDKIYAFLLNCREYPGSSGAERRKDAADKKMIAAQVRENFRLLQLNLRYLMANLGLILEQDFCSPQLGDWLE